MRRAISIGLVGYLAMCGSVAAADCSKEVLSGVCEMMEQSKRDAERSSWALEQSRRDMNRDFLQSMEMRDQTNELRRIGRELEDLNAARLRGNLLGD